MFNLTSLFFNPGFVYYLALQKCKRFSDWTIHGLWIDYQSGGYPEFCKNVQFDLVKLNPIIDQLYREWPSCIGYSKSLWKHEYEKHASCFEKDIPQLLYFNTTLTLFKKINLSKCNGRNCLIKIRPSDIFNTYTSSFHEIITDIIWYV